MSLQPQEPGAHRYPSADEMHADYLHSIQKDTNLKVVELMTRNETGDKCHAIVYNPFTYTGEQPSASAKLDPEERQALLDHPLHFQAETPVAALIGAYMTWQMWEENQDPEVQRLIASRINQHKGWLKNSIRIVK
jgi:hypothetical protein